MRLYDIVIIVTHENPLVKRILRKRSYNFIKADKKTAKLRLISVILLIISL